MKQVVRGLGVLLAGAIIVRTCAQLIAPAIPLLVTLFAMVGGAYLVSRRRLYRGSPVPVTGMTVPLQFIGLRGLGAVTRKHEPL